MAFSFRAVVEGSERMRSYRFHRRSRIAVVMFVAAAAAAPIVAHAFASSSDSKIEVVGAAAKFASASSTAPATAWPAGTQVGDFVASYVEASPPSAITCAKGWTKRLDTVNASATRLVACTRFRTNIDAPPSAAVSPAAHVSMITMAFSEVDPDHPVAAAAGTSGLLAPAANAARSHSLMVLAQGSPHWRVDFIPPQGARKVDITNDGAGSELATAVQDVAHPGTVPARRWTHVPAVPHSSVSANAAQRAQELQDDQKSAPTSVTSVLILNLAGGTPPTTKPGSTSTTVGNPPPGAAPETPPAKICGNKSVLDGPSTAPAGAVTIPAGDNVGLSWKASTTYWFAPGVHTLGNGEYNQIIPADHDVFVGAPGAVIDGQRKNDFAFTQHAEDVTVEHLTIRNFTAPLDQGVVNHDSADGWTIAANTIVNNDGAGMMAGAGQVVRDNCLDSNGQYAINAYQAGGGITDLTIDHNEISRNNTGDWDTVHPGCGCTGGLKLWSVRGASITGNWVHNNRGVGVWADTDNVAVEIGGNYISNNDGEGVMYEASYNASIHDNTLVANAWKFGPTNPGFPTGAIYISESGGDARVSSRYSTFQISGNVMKDNWSGVILWENADRFCNSPANPTNDCTEGGKASKTTCVAGTIANAPYYSDCRWKTQNISVHDNEFNLDPSAVPGCAANKGCGYNGVFSQWGTYPSWSPYQKETIEDAITFHQNDVFADNVYNGPWRIMVHDQATTMSVSDWQDAPYHQDLNSVMNP